MMRDVEVSCLPKDLPEFLELDLSAMNLNDTLFLTDIKLPAGVTIPAAGAWRNPPVVSIHAPRVAEPEPVAAEAAAYRPRACRPQAPWPARAAAEGATGAKAAEAKKDEDKKEAGRPRRKAARSSRWTYAA